MNTSIIAPRALNFLTIILFTRGSRPSALDRQLRQAPIINGEGMGVDLPYLWLGLVWCYMSLVCYVAPHPWLGSPSWPNLGIGLRVQIEVKFGHSSGSTLSW
jgi:hypothetical protein